LESRHYEWWQENKESFDRPFEIVLVQTPEDTIMAVHLFHALYDANSLSLLMQSIAAGYHGHQNVTYGPPFHEALLHGPLGSVHMSKEFWIAHLNGHRGTAMPSLASEDGDSSTSASLSFQIGGELERLRRDMSVTHQAVVQACWASVLQTF